MTAAQKKRFEDLVFNLNLLMTEIEQTHPRANYYLACESLHVMDGPSHDDVTGRPLSKNSMAHAILLGSGGGDW